MESSNKTWKIWLFVIALNSMAIGGAFYLRAIGIDLHAFRGGS
tara:strand:- start:721 stop:849 length:129 start_codon:yes stop_codon:yes gene_type:complete